MTSIKSPAIAKGIERGGKTAGIQCGQYKLFNKMVAKYFVLN
jgi:hypothetical protein